MYIGIDNLSNIYSLGIDSVGSFIIAGERNKNKS